jgi:hypothetical protein
VTAGWQSRRPRTASATGGEPGARRSSELRRAPDGTEQGEGSRVRARARPPRSRAGAAPAACAPRLGRSCRFVRQASAACAAAHRDRGGALCALRRAEVLFAFGVLAHRFRHVPDRVAERAAAEVASDAAPAEAFAQRAPAFAPRHDGRRFGRRRWTPRAVPRRVRRRPRAWAGRRERVRRDRTGAAVSDDRHAGRDRRRHQHLPAGGRDPLRTELRCEGRPRVGARAARQRQERGGQRCRR